MKTDPFCCRYTTGFTVSQISQSLIENVIKSALAKAMEGLSISATCAIFQCSETFNSMQVFY